MISGNANFVAHVFLVFQILSSLFMEFLPLPHLVQVWGEVRSVDLDYTEFQRIQYEDKEF